MSEAITFAISKGDGNGQMDFLSANGANWSRSLAHINRNTMEKRHLERPNRSLTQLLFRGFGESR